MLDLIIKNDNNILEVTGDKNQTNQYLKPQRETPQNIEVNNRIWISTNFNNGNYFNSNITLRLWLIVPEPTSMGAPPPPMASIVFAS